MGITSNIRKILFIALWCTVGAGLLVLLVAAIRVKSHKTCKGYKINITGSGDRLFIDKKDIDAVLVGTGGYTFTGKKLASINLNKLEEMLKKNPWVKKVDLFFDNNQVLRVNVNERKPIARIFTSSGNSFYIDEAGDRMPLSAKYAARLPVFTGFPTDKIKMNKIDSVLMKDVITLATYTTQNKFWRAQVAQIDITPTRTFEFVPTIGDHVVEFGSTTNYEKKFNRLYKFYRDVMAKTSFNKYDRIKIQYDKQIVGVKKAMAVSKYDSLQAVKNVQLMIMEFQKQQQELIANDSTGIRD